MSRKKNLNTCTICEVEFEYGYELVIEKNKNKKVFYACNEDHFKQLLHKCNNSSIFENTK